MDDIEFPATQPVLPSLLGDVVAFVEVRSGHDNRSRGVISELRSLGADIATTLNKDVTHVVFQGGHVSIYKKAKQQMLHVVAVSWIEASKQLGCKAPEEEHPPPGFEKYEDPHAARKIKVMKSMQPAFDDEKDDERLNAILDRIKKKGAKRPEYTEDEVSSEKPRKRKCSTASEKKQNESSATTLSISLGNSAGKTASAGRTAKSKKRGFSVGSKATNENGSPPKRRKSKNSKSESRSGGPSCSTNGDTENKEETETRESNEADSTVQEPRLNLFESFQFKMPKPVTKQNGLARLALHSKKGGQPLKPSSATQLPGSTAKSDDENETSEQRTKEIPSLKERPVQSRPFEFEMPKPVTKQNGLARLALHSKKGGQPLKPSSATQLPGSTAKSDNENETSEQRTKEIPSLKERPVQSRPLGFIENITRDTDARKAELEEKPQRQTRRSVGLADRQESHTPQPQTKEVNPFIARVLETLAKKQKPRVHLKSPWRRQGEGTQRRESPRLSALRKDTCAIDPTIDESMSPVVPKKMEPRRPVSAVHSSASAHMLKFWRAKPSKVSSPEVALLDISFGPARAPISERRSSDASTASSVSTASSHQSTPGNKFPQGLLEALSLDLTDLDRSDSPILGTKVKRRELSTGANSSCASTKSLPAVASSLSKSSTTAASKGSLSTSTLVVNRSESEGKTANESLDTSTRSTRGSRRKSLPAVASSLSKTSTTTASKGSLSTSTLVVNRSESEGKTANESLDSSTRSTRGSRRKEVLPTLVCTHLSGSDVKRVMKAIKSLGKFQFEEQVSERTSHVVASGPRRTINMLRAIARGCWILRDEWVYRSVEARRWLPEEDFELTEFSPLVQERRLLRQSSSGLGQWDLLSSVGPIFVSSASQPRPSELKDLVLLSGGTLSRTIEEASLIIGPPIKKNKHSKVRVAPVWVLDCIQKGVKQSLTASEYS